MSKFIKRVQKSSGRTENALVIGTGFGHLQEILEIYKNVFLINDTMPEIKSKNLIYREKFNNLVQFSDINAIFVDLNKVDKLPELKDFWQRNKSVVLIEGNDPIGRDKSLDLFNTKWGCTSLQGDFHVWEEIK